MSSSSASVVENRGPTVLAVTVAVLVASFVFVLLRLVSRIAIVQKVSTDDHLIVLAWLLSFGLSFAICFGTTRGLGLRDADIRDEWEPTLRRSQYVFLVLYNPALMATKTSILVFYLRLSRAQQGFRRASIATLSVVNIAGFALTVVNIFQCNPVGAVFEYPLPSSATCTDIVTLFLSLAPINIITDLAILFLPMPILTKMCLPKKQKTILVITFALGGFAAVVDVIRIAYLQSASQARLTQLEILEVEGISTAIEQIDLLWYASLSFMWSAVEVNVGIICACIPTLKPLVSRIMPWLVHSAHDHNENNGGDISSASRLGSKQKIEQRLSPNADTDLENPPPTHLLSGSGDTQAQPNILEFLTTSDTVGKDVGRKRRSQRTIDSRLSVPGSTADFINLGPSKNMIKLSNRESLIPLAMVTFLFFLWGFAYGLLNVLNGQFQTIARISPGQSIALHGAYFAAYLCGPLTVGQFVLKKWGFKPTFITGLCIYGCGTLVFWPSSVLTSFPAFLISNFIVAFGLSILEIAANPFIALCGPPAYAETRLGFSQAIQAVGSVLSPILAQRVLFRSVLNAPSLIDVQWTYLGIAMFVVILAVIFHYTSLPEASDIDLDELAEQRPPENSKTFFGKPIIFTTLALGVFSQFCYVGGQEGASYYFQSYINSVGADISNLTLSDYQAIAHTTFALGRFVSSLATIWIQPRRVLLFFYSLSLFFSVLSINLKGASGAVSIILFEFFEAPIFPMVFAMCLRGLGSRTKSGSALLTAAVSGGALAPGIMRPIGERSGVPYSFCVVVALFSFGLIFPIYLNAVPAAKRQVDIIDLNSGPEFPIGHNGAPRKNIRKGHRGSAWKRQPTTSERPIISHRSWPP
ncbi:MAG: hypothetical protein M1829_002894 [Trizodia sp. TS-e1964]|nr:MAG: hypothetical protein M1829_002894 [Trizodia sp. TS-e1964]